MRDRRDIPQHDAGDSTEHGDAKEYAHAGTEQALISGSDVRNHAWYPAWRNACFRMPNPFPMRATSSGAGGCQCAAAVPKSTPGRRNGSMTTGPSYPIAFSVPAISPHGT